MSFDISRLRRADWIVGGGTVALFILMFFFKWFGVNLPGVAEAYLHVAGFSASADAWHTMSGIRWILLATIVAGVTLVVLAGSGRKLELPVSMGVIVAGLGALATILVFYRAIISHPASGESTKIGAYLGIVACAAITYGGYLVMGAEGTTLSDVREQASGAISGVTSSASHGSPPDSGGAAPSGAGSAPVSTPPAPPAPPAAPPIPPAAQPGPPIPPPAASPGPESPGYTPPPSQGA
jgi:hypothetical protein